MRYYFGRSDTNNSEIICIDKCKRKELLYNIIYATILENSAILDDSHKLNKLDWNII